VTTLAYALLAPQGIALSLWAVGFGLVLCALRLWRGSLWAGAIVHFVVGVGPKVVATLSP
jgi:membrane protease YdiL (CAAX protease family)